MYVFLFVVSWQKSLLNELESGLVIITDFSILEGFWFNIIGFVCRPLRNWNQPIVSLKRRSHTSQQSEINSKWCLTRMSVTWRKPLVAGLPKNDTFPELNRDEMFVHELFHMYGRKEGCQKVIIVKRLRWKNKVRFASLLKELAYDLIRPLD